MYEKKTLSVYSIFVAFCTGLILSGGIPDKRNPSEGTNIPARETRLESPITPVPEGKTQPATLLISISPDVPAGFASATGDGWGSGVTGGGKIGESDNIVTISGPQEFARLVTLLYDRRKAYKIKADNNTARYVPLVIILNEGTYPDQGPVSNTGSTWGNSMLAIEEQGDISIVGKGNVILNFGINVKRSYNILIRNLTFQDFYDDGINVGEPETHHVWIDHCTFGHPSVLPADSDHPDGCCDIKNGASYVTVSWCMFRNSWKTSLVGHSDNNGATDSGRLKVTYFANCFTGSNSRHPRVRFGEVHVLNNYYENIGSYGIAAANSAQVYAEGNFFRNTRFPMYSDRTKADFTKIFGPLESYTGNYPATGLKQVNNRFDDTLLPVLTSSFVNPQMLNPGNRSIRFDEYHPEKVFQPEWYYAYDTLQVVSVPEIVLNYAGAGKFDFVTETDCSRPAVANNLMTIFPNPALPGGNIVVNRKGTLKIYNPEGKILVDKRNHSADQPVKLDKTGFNSGFYFVVSENIYGRESGILVVR